MATHQAFVKIVATHSPRRSPGKAQSNTVGKPKQRRLQDRQQYDKAHFLRYLHTKTGSNSPDNHRDIPSRLQSPDFDLNHVPNDVKVDGFFKKMQRKVEECLGNINILKLNLQELKDKYLKEFP